MVFDFHPTENQRMQEIKTNSFIERAIRAFKDDLGETVARIVGPAIAGTFTLYVFFGLIFEWSGFTYFGDGFTHAVIDCVHRLVPGRTFVQIGYVLMVGTLGTFLVASALELAFDVAKKRP